MQWPSLRSCGSLPLARRQRNMASLGSPVNRRVGLTIFLWRRLPRRNWRRKAHANQIILVCSLFFFAPHSTPLHHTIHPFFLDWLIFLTHPISHSQNKHTHTHRDGQDSRVQGCGQLAAQSRPIPPTQQRQQPRQPGQTGQGGHGLRRVLAARRIHRQGDWRDANETGQAH